MRGRWSVAVVAVMIVVLTPQGQSGADGDTLGEAGAAGLPDPTTEWIVPPEALTSGIVHLCDGAAVDVSGEKALEAHCDTREIRPGAWGYGCTLNFVLTDGSDDYIGTAGHCGGVGQNWYVPGVGHVGETVYSEYNNALLSYRDWSLVRINGDKTGHINPTMYRYGGPHTPVPGVDSRPPVPGEIVYQYGHGQGMGKEDPTKGRVGVVLGLLGTTAFVYAGMAGGGDSGSPVRFASGEPAGIAVAYVGTATPELRDHIDEATLRTHCGNVERATLGTVDPCVGRDTGCAQLEALGADTFGVCDDVCTPQAGGLDPCTSHEPVCWQLDNACDGPLRPDNGLPLVIVARFDAALAAFEAGLGRDLSVVDGDLPV